MVELLAPAGTPDALRAAIAAGADAVYVGLGAFNARAANAGFTLGELERSCVLAHARGARVYVTLNVYVRDAELDDAVALAARALAAGADALIVADPGLISRLRTELPGAELHLSTQAGAQCADAVRLAAREFGVGRVTCARELSVPELAELCATGVEIEAFCHGAICICYSGACSYSALMRGRSANRGDCTQPCRLAYELQDGSGAVLAGGSWERGRVSGRTDGRAEGDPDACAEGGARAAAGGSRRDGAPGADAGAARRDGAPGAVPGVPVGDARAGARDRALIRPEGDRLLCPRDYLGIRHIAEMVGAGVSAFKIEGRMKSPDYVYNVVRCYREALDAVLVGHPLGEAEVDELEARLARSFSRGFTSGYLEGGHAATGAGLMSIERAINQGLYVGHVSEPRYGGALVTFERDVAAGDMLEIHSTPGPDAPADVPKRWPIVACPRDVRSGEEAFIPCKRKVEAGSAVHVVRSADMISAADAAVRAMREEEARLVESAWAIASSAAGADASGAPSAGDDGCAGDAMGPRPGDGVGEVGAGESRLGAGVCAGGSVESRPGAGGRAVAEPVRFAHARRGRKNGREMPVCGSVADPDQKSAGTGGKTVANCQAVTAWQIPIIQSVHNLEEMGANCQVATAWQIPTENTAYDPGKTVAICQFVAERRIPTKRPELNPGKTVANCQAVTAWQIPTVSEAIRDGSGAVVGTATWATSGAASESSPGAAADSPGDAAESPGDAGESSPGAAGEPPRDIVDLGEVCRAGDLAEVRAACARVARGGALAVMVRNIGQIPAVLAAGVPWEAAPPLQVWNAATALALVRLGARRVWIPEELTVEDLESVREHVAAEMGASRTEPIMVGTEAPRGARAAAAGAVAPSARVVIRDRARRLVDIVPAGATPLMITEHCPLTAEGPCSNACLTCPRRLASQAGDRFLVELDRKSSGARLAVRVDERGRTRLYRM